MSTTCHDAARVGMTDATRRQVLARLKRAEGQLAGVCRMVEEERYCVDVLTQLAAVEGALARVGELVLSSHLRTCVATAMASGDADAVAQKVEEVLEIFTRFGR